MCTKDVKLCQIPSRLFMSETAVTQLSLLSLVSQQPGERFHFTHYSVPYLWPAVTHACTITLNLKAELTIQLQELLIPTDSIA